jgi:hypothetical protein
MSEVLVVLNHVSPRAAQQVRKRMATTGGQVRQQYGPEVLIVEAEPEAIRALEAEHDVAGVFTGTVPEDLASQLDETGKLGVAAWNQRQSAEFQQAKQERHGEGLAWDDPGHEPEGRQEP